MFQENERKGERKRRRHREIVARQSTKRKTFAYLIRKIPLKLKTRDQF